MKKLAGQKLFAKLQNSLQSQNNKMTKSNSKNRHTINLQKLLKKHNKKSRSKQAKKELLQTKSNNKYLRELLQILTQLLYSSQ